MIISIKMKTKQNKTKKADVFPTWYALLMRSGRLCQLITNYVSGGISVRKEYKEWNTKAYWNIKIRKHNLIWSDLH